MKDMTKRKCWECGKGKYQLASETRTVTYRKQTMELVCEYYKCPKCGEGIVSGEQSQKQEDQITERFPNYFKVKRRGKPNFNITEVTLKCFKARPEAKSKGGFELKWGTVSAGHGSTTFWVGEDNKVRCEAECMGSKFILSVFKKFLETVEMDSLTQETIKERNNAGKA